MNPNNFQNQQYLQQQQEQQQQQQQQYQQEQYQQQVAYQQYMQYQQQVQQQQQQNLPPQQPPQYYAQYQQPQPVYASNDQQQQNMQYMQEQQQYGQQHDTQYHEPQIPANDWPTEEPNINNQNEIQSQNIKEPVVNKQQLIDSDEETRTKKPKRKRRRNKKKKKSQIKSQENEPKKEQNPTDMPPIKNLNLNIPKVEQKKSETKSKNSKSKPKNTNKLQEIKEEIIPKKRETRKKPKWDVHDPREHLNLVLIGHVDAGKSTISGQILLQTGQIDERTIAKFRKEAKEKNRESWWIAYIMDKDEEERTKGKTVECGKAHFDTPVKRYTILDAPGHKNYVPNMISGASQADVAILVISARRGEFEAGFDRGGQTREHGLLALTLGIDRVIIAVNKMDTCEWNKERYTTIKQKIRSFLIEIGFRSKYISCLPISGQEDINITRRLDSKICEWYDGKCLVEQLDSLKIIKRPYDSALRIPVLDRYKGDRGIQAIGKLESGGVKVGDSVTVMPTNITTVIDAIAIDDTPVQQASAGENVLLSFEKGIINMNNIYGGCVICVPTNISAVVTDFVASIYLNDSPISGILTVGYTAMFHCHNVSLMCEIVRIPHLVNKKNGKWSKKAPPFLRVKNSAIVHIQLSEGCALETFEDFPPLGRFTLRDQGKTVIIGKIIQVDAGSGLERQKKGK